MDSEGMLRHLVFFEELGKMDENDAGWRAVSAGLVTMRLVDQWIADGPTSTRVDSWSVSAVREAIAQIPDTTPVRRILSSVVDVMVSSTAIDMHALTPRLMAYAQALEFEARWVLAADVYRTITAQTHPIEDADLSVAAHSQLGFCLRTLGEFDEAKLAYEQASAVAAATNDLIGVLRGRLGVARIAAMRGNLPAADKLLEEAIAGADAENMRELKSMALNDRAYVAGVGGHWNRSIRFSYEALELSQSQRHRDRILNNIATAFRLLGLYDAARDSYLVLAATAEEQYIRWHADVNLMELAAQQGIELQFDKYRRDLEGSNFPPDLRVTYLLHVGRGYHSLGNADAGISYLERAIQVASEYQLNQAMFEAEEALASARRDRRPKRQSVSFDASNVQEVIDAIHEMKQAVGSR
jgi:tetratricopeptide (TPR) repeat protein